MHTYEDVLQEFGKAVSDGVLSLSKDESLATKEEQMRDSLDRIRRQPREIWMVKMADRIANLRYPPHHWESGKIRAYREEAMVIHQALHKGNKPLANRLLDKVVAYERFFEVA